MATRASSTVENYLLVIYYAHRDGDQVIGARLAETLGVSLPTVTATLQRMQRDGLIDLRAHKEIRLTAKGQTMAEDITRRHALAERLLTDVLGMSWDEAHAEAHNVEHGLSERVEARLMQALGNPTTCPHGNPIPGTGAEARLTGVPLSTFSPGQHASIERITEAAEEDPDLLRYLERNGLGPGARVKVAEVARFNDLMVLETAAGQRLPLGMRAAAKLRANPVSPTDETPPADEHPPSR